MGSCVIGLKVQSLTSADGAREGEGRGAQSSSGSAAASCPLQLATISALTTDHVPRAPALSGSAAGSQPGFASAPPFRTASAALLFSSAFCLTARSRFLFAGRETERHRGANAGLPRSFLLLSGESRSWRPLRRSRRLWTIPGRCPP